MNYIPHAVENSGYAAMESTGGLPVLLDVSSKSDNHKDGDVGRMGDSTKPDYVTHWAEILSELDSPVFVGRNQPGGLGSSFFHHHQSTKRSDTGKLPTISTTSSHPSTFLPSGSHIVDYLRLKHSQTMKDNLLFPEHFNNNQGEQPSLSLSGDAMAYETLIQEKLNYILQALRYGTDPAWEGVYKPQCIRATLDPNGEYAVANNGAKPKSFFSLFAWYQTYSERALAIHNLRPSTHAMAHSTHGGLALELFRYNDHRRRVNESKHEETKEDEEGEEKEVHQHHPFASFFPSHGGGGGGDTGKVNVYRAMEWADRYYAALEGRLSSEQSEQSTFLLGTKKPTYVDAMLFAHLAEALCDVHLILVLAKHSRLMRYFQSMYVQYFGEEYAKTWQSQNSAEPADWIQKNDIANALNAFNQIPEAKPTKNSTKGAVTLDDGHDMAHAIQLMQTMAVHCNELDEALRDAAALRMVEGKEKAVLDSYHRPIGSRLYRWIMGGEIDIWGSGETKSVDADEAEHGDDSQSEDGTNADKETTPEEDAKQRVMKEQMKRMKRDRRAQDELWMSGVVVAVAAVLVISASGKSKG